MPSAIPYSSGSAPAITPPVWLMCSTPGSITSALRSIVADESRALLEVGGDAGELAAHDAQVERQPGDQQDDVDDGQHDQRRSRPHLAEDTAEEQVVLEALGEHGVDAGPRSRRSARCRRCWPPPACSVSRIDDDPPVDRAHQQDEDREQRGDREDDDEAADDRAPPQVLAGSRSARGSMVSLPAWRGRAGARR